MAIIVNPEPGVVLVGEFDKANPEAREEVKIFSQRLMALKQQQGFEAFVPLITREGNRFSITIIPCALGTEGSVTDAAGLKDSFKGSGRLPAPPSQGPDPYADARDKDAGDLTSSWFSDES
ncbi:MAG: hypothetical protein JWM80_6436 [Cyanobacteria bacterium RYN_339]|nr:hypothetical protein [Cyanobacteria bacterium RYN_339]